MAETVIQEGAVVTATDGGLIVQAAAGDRLAFDRLLGDRLDGLYYTALGILRHEADARDAVQDACVQAWLHLRSLRTDDRFDAWLGRILINSCRARLRTRKRMNVREIDMSAREDAAPGAVDQEVAEADAVRRAFGRLKADDRILLALHHADRRSIEEIATLLGIPEGTAKWRLHAARAALTKALGREQ